MLVKILDETLTKLEKYEKMNPSEIKYSQATFDRLKIQLNLYKAFWVEQATNRLVDLHQ